MSAALLCNTAFNLTYMYSSHLDQWFPLFLAGLVCVVEVEEGEEEVLPGPDGA